MPAVKLNSPAASTDNSVAPRPARRGGGVGIFTHFHFYNRHAKVGCPKLLPRALDEAASVSTQACVSRRIHRRIVDRPECESRRLCDLRPQKS